MNEDGIVPVSRSREVSDVGVLGGWCWEKSCIKRTWGSAKKAMWGVSALAMGGLVILVMSLLSVLSPMKVYPKEPVVPTAAVAATAAATVDYYLPYPGLLPDSPLYKLKAVRDRVVLWLTWGEENKAKRELMLADKRIAAARVLVEGGKESLGITTATKAEKYLESAVGRVIKLSAAGVDVKSTLLNLEKACTKHEEVLVALEEEAGVKLNTQLCGEKVKQALVEAK